ncbi:MAG TPA: ATP-dependent DNA ligase [Candidatus Binatia bacterium]|nr:ATP-dependent DNA ligase [Candidatus Binatia bacterium]
MTLPLKPPILPMLAKRAEALPDGEGWRFEPKWDGFRALVFRDGGEVYLQSRDGRPLARYFPDLLAPLAQQLPTRCVLDGEIVIEQGGALDFEALQLRLHPAASRVALLAQRQPAAMVFFDLLALGDADLTGEAFARRRARLERIGTRLRAPLHVTPATADRTEAADWFRRFEGAGLDGIVAKRAGGRYEPDQRVMVKVKHARECDCVVAGFRWHRSGRAAGVGSLLLGLYDAAGQLQHVGVCASFTAAMRRDLVKVLEPHRVSGLRGHPWQDWAEAAVDEAGRRRPGASSRWSAGKDLSWEPLRIGLVAEVGYDHMQGDRFRHTAQFRRWRPDKPARECTYAQLEVAAPEELASIFGDGLRARRRPKVTTAATAPRPRRP